MGLFNRKVGSGKRAPGPIVAPIVQSKRPQPPGSRTSSDIEDIPSKSGEEMIITIRRAMTAYHKTNKIKPEYLMLNSAYYFLYSYNFYDTLVPNVWGLKLVCVPDQIESFKLGH